MRIRAYTVCVSTSAAVLAPRWELYKLLAEPIRLRLLALSAREELAIGELAELTGESQPNVSRHLKPLRGAGLLMERKEGTRVYVRLNPARRNDAVVCDALRTGESLCEDDQSMARIADVLAAREAPARDFFAQARGDGSAWPSELGAYLSALAPLIARRGLAVDVGTGDGSLLEVIAPVFDEVIAFDRSEAQLTAAKGRLSRRHYGHVTVFNAELGDTTVAKAVADKGGADAVFAARVLHHASKPAASMAAIAELVAPGGIALVLDYVAHGDESMRDEQADTWLGFSPRELTRFAKDAGLCDIHVSPIPAIRCGDGPDGHLDWQVLSATNRSAKRNESNVRA